MKNITQLLFLLILLTANTVFAQTATPPSGTGTIGDPYQIATLNNLYWVTQNSVHWNKYFIQTTNIDASTTNTWNAGAGFNQIGNSSTRFTGSYDGQGHTISNLYISRAGTNYIGLFGWVNPPAVIKQLGVLNASIVGGVGTGCLIGYISGGGSVTVQKCYSSGAATGTYACGGLIGVADIGTISLSYSTATANISSGVSECGGFIGENRAAISNCYATGNVSSTPSFTGGGGFAGANYGGSITNCFSTGTITGAGTKGGLVGTVALAGTAPNSFWDTQSSSQATSAQGTGRTTAQMKTSSTFTAAGWDFMGETTNGNNDYWNIDGVTNNGYAALQYFTLLPVTWLSFTAQNQVNAVLLNWQTATEQNTLHFVVQHSIDGINWTNIGTIAAAGNSSTVSSYNFKHKSPENGNNYYRLIEKNIEGKSGYSNLVKCVFMQAGSGLRIYPNLVVDGKLSIEFNNKMAGSYSITILSTSGSLIYQNNVKHNGLNTTYTLQLPTSLNKALYQVNIKGIDGNNTTFKLMIAQ